MAHELKALGPVYLQALCRRLLVGEVLWAVLEAHPDSELLMQALRDPPAPDGPSDEATVASAGSGASDRSDPASTADDGTNLHDSLPGLPSLSVPATAEDGRLTPTSAAAVQTVRDSEGWGFVVDLALRRAPPVVPEEVFVPIVESPEQLQALGGWVQDHGGQAQALLPQDFSTGLVCLNRFLRAFKVGGSGKRAMGPHTRLSWRPRALATPCARASAPNQTPTPLTPFLPSFLPSFLPLPPRQTLPQEYRRKILFGSDVIIP